jgi:hypothetical protein
MAKELRLKTEMHLTMVLGFGLGSGSESRGGGDAIASPAVAVCRVLECLADPPPPSRDDDVPPYDALGRLLLAKHAMERTFVSDSAAIVLPDPRIVVDLLESVIFVDVPSCHRLVRCSSSPPSSSSSSMVMVRDHLRRRAVETLSDLARVLESASHSLCLSGESDDDVRSMRRYRRQRSIIRQHHLLVRWLAPAGSSSVRCRDRAEYNHPLTNEVILHILQRRVMISCSVDDDYSREDASHLISLLSELLFHRQTEVSHRRNIATLLIRLLSSSSDGAHANERADARRLTRESLWACLKHSGAIDPTRRKKRKRSDATRSSLLPPDDVRTICSVLESLANAGSIDGDASGGMRHFWQDVLSNNLLRVRGGGREVDRVAFVLSLSIGAARASSTLAAFFIAFDSDGILSCGNTSPDSFVGSLLNFVAAQRINGRIKTDDSARRRVILQSVCIGLIVALSGCVGRDMPEAQFRRIAEVLNDSAESASADASVHAIGLRHITVNAASSLGDLIRSDFGERSLKVCLVSRLRSFPAMIFRQRQRITVAQSPFYSIAQPLAETINRTLEESSWYYIAPGISSLECLFQTLPNHLKKGIVNAMPALGSKSSVTRKLFTSRLKKETYSVALEETIDPTTLDASYAIPQECRFLLSCCNGRATKGSLTFLDYKSILLQSGSKVFVHRDKDGKVLAVVVVPIDGHLSSPSEILSAMAKSEYESHSVNSNCEMRL